MELPLSLKVLDDEDKWGMGKAVGGSVHSISIFRWNTVVLGDWRTTRGPTMPLNGG